MKRGRGINGRDDRSSGIEIRMAEALAKINPTDPLIQDSRLFSFLKTDFFCSSPLLSCLGQFLLSLKEQIFVLFFQICILLLGFPHQVFQVLLKLLAFSIITQNTAVYEFPTQ
jgi:hypothetical protein